MKILPEQIAIWVRSMYTVMYYPNVPLGVTYSGTMPNQPCTVGEVYTVPENQYLCTGYRFQGWNTKMDGTGKSYNTAESGQDGLSQENGATIKLYAQWSKCEHNAANLTYRINKNETGLIQTCSCGAHTAEVTLQTVDQVYDKKEHPVTLRYSGDTWSQAIPDIQYEWRKAGTNDAYTSVNGNPKLAGQYQVTMTAPLGSSASETGTCMFTYKSTEEQKGDLYQLDFTPNTGVTSNLNIKVTISGVKANAVIAATREAGQFFEQFLVLQTRNIRWTFFHKTFGLLQDGK